MNNITTVSLIIYGIYAIVVTVGYILTLVEVQEKSDEQLTFKEAIVTYIAIIIPVLIPVVYYKSYKQDEQEKDILIKQKRDSEILNWLDYKLNKRNVWWAYLLVY